MIGALKKIFDVRSKTFAGVLLGVLGILIAGTDFYPDLPKAIPIAVQIIGFVLAAFGIFDAMLQEQETLTNRVRKFFADNFGAGIALEALIYLVDRIPEMPDVPGGAVIAAQIVAALLIAMGLRGEGAKARLKQSPTSEQLKLKYLHLKE